VIPNSTMGLKPSLRMGPPPRSLAVDAHGCIMVRIRWDPPHTRLPGDTSPAVASSPLVVLCQAAVARRRYERLLTLMVPYKVELRGSIPNHTRTR
jgi:hypothetical protein